MLRTQIAILNGVGLCLLLAGMSAIDKDVGRHVVNIVSGDAASELGIVLAPISRASSLAFDTLHDYQIDNSPLVLFAVVAVVLFTLAFRS